MIQSVLFDIDGVLLSEERCFDSSALAVWELLHSPNYLGIHSEGFTPTPTEQMVRKIRSAVFCRDQVLAQLKSLGLNSNWDMVYLTFIYQLVSLISKLDEKPKVAALDLLEGSPLDQESLSELASLLPENIQLDFAGFTHDSEWMQRSKGEIIESFHSLIASKCDLKDDVVKGIPSQKDLWELGREVFQEWYVGDAFIEASIGKKAKQVGKIGFLQEEIPLASAGDLNRIFEWLSEKGFDIGIGTGRPAVETFEPLKAFGLLRWIPADHVVTSDDVLNAEALYPDYGALGKPHPYTYLQSYYGKRMPVGDVLSTKLPVSTGENVLIIGDSVADFYAARSMGAQFAAVLTGLTGEEARSEFEALGVTYILDRVIDIIPLLAKLNKKGPSLW